ncbi:chromate efflux transporter [Geobacter sp. AOG1]|uniref:chromate efflux transporter n=1 Tax=Geobacter sp. AOG1 TaxID=1566346 RepID=UPI001CC79C80|nr:chromate efflux transporter [Geobacter sp. AOG1]GFE57576.1 chromate resistance transporter [Geobacter sp. AOG1]
MSSEYGDECTLRALSLYFLRLGATGFGGPIALAAYMQRDLVPKGWLTDQEYAEGLAFSQMMPGPLAAQLAMWIGFLRHGTLGASLVGILFILPAFLIVLAISVLYVRFRGLQVVQALFYGIGPAVIAIVAMSAARLAWKTVHRQISMWMIFAATAVVTVAARTEIAALFLVAGVIGYLLSKPGNTTQLPPLAAVLPIGAAASAPKLSGLLFFFLKAGAFTFGSGLAIVPFLHQGVVLGHHWLTEQQFLDAVAVGIITPGPVVITAAFVGYLTAGFWGSIVAAAAVFLPVYFFVLFIGRHIIRHRGNTRLQGFIRGATAAASGAIAGASVILGEQSIYDAVTVATAAGSFILLVLKVPEPAIVAAGALVGLWAKGFF